LAVKEEEFWKSGTYRWIDCFTKQYSSGSPDIYLCCQCGAHYEPHGYKSDVYPKTTAINTFVKEHRHNKQGDLTSLFEWWWP
jgi:hypothetical protein